MISQAGLEKEASGRHGVRVQWDYARDMLGWPRPSGPDGTHWARVGTAALADLSFTIQAGLFAAFGDYSNETSQSIGGQSSSGDSTQAAVFDHVNVAGAWPAGARAGTDIGGPNGPSPGRVPLVWRRVHRHRSGDIAPVADAGAGSVAQTLVGMFAGLIGVITVAAIFITAEYRRGLIRLTLTARPRRTRALAAKAVVIGAVSFAVGLPAAFAALGIEESITRPRISRCPRGGRRHVPWPAPAGCCSPPSR